MGFSTGEDGSGGLPLVVTEQPTEALTANDWSRQETHAPVTLDHAVLQPLVVPLPVIVGQVFPQSFAE